MDKKPLNVLMVEDSEADAELVVRELRQSGFAPEWKRVQTEPDFCASLDPKLDIILSDYAMPNFDGLRALELLKENHLDIPFIIVSGTIGEDVAVKAMRGGASDYLLKDRLARLGQSVEHALEEKRMRDQNAQIQTRLVFQEQQYRLLFEINPNPMWVFDNESLQILAVNQAAIAQYGYSRDEFLKLTLKDLRPPEGVPELLKARALSSPMAMSHYSGQFQHQKKDGALIVVEIYSSPLFWDGVAARIVSAIDVTERKRAEEVLAESERRFREMLENVELIAATLDKNGTITFCNDYLLQLTGWSREEVIGANWFSIFIPETCPTLKKLFFDSLAAGTIPAHRENPIKTRTGQLKEVVWNNTLLRDIEGNIIGTASIGEDVTERKKVQERLREQADIINRAHDAVIIRNFDDDRVTFWNRGAERMYGWSATEAVGRPLGDLIFGEPAHREALVQQLKSTGEYHGEIKHRTKDGQEVIVDSRVTLIRNDDETPRAVLGVNTDITEQKKLETQLLRAQRLESIGTLASGVAHDLNNILTPIMMCSEVLRRQISGPGSEATIKLIEDSARRGAGIVKQVLTFARGIEGERVLIKPNHLIDEMIDIAKKTFPKSIEISSRYPEDLWMIRGDPTQLHQVLLNLSVNARDAMPDGGTLVIQGENVNMDENYAAMMPGATPGPYVSIRVTDTGSGMPRATVEKIFDPFFTTKEIGKGTGLGLSTSLGIVKSHGGFISVYSEVDKGTTFRIFLPASMADEAVSPSETPAELLQGSGELVLVVDDEQNILSVTRMILENKGYRVITAHDGPEAVAIFAQEMDSIRVVLTDMSLPFMDGMALIMSLKKMKPETLFVASTGQGARLYRDELDKLGVKNLLTKPYDTQKLLETLRDALVSGKE